MKAKKLSTGLYGYQGVSIARSPSGWWFFVIGGYEHAASTLRSACAKIDAIISSN